MCLINWHLTELMSIKNRKFNVAGATIYQAKVSAGDLVFFQLEPNNPNHGDAIKILNQLNQVVGYIPRGSVDEIQLFRQGKYPYYCAKVKELWRGSEGLVPQVLAHFASDISELPYAGQAWS